MLEVVILAAVALPVLCVMAVIIAAILRFGNRPRSDAEETKLIQEMHRNLEKLENRIESLETIILEHERAGKGATS